MTTFAPDSLALNRKLPLWYQVSQSLRASILGRGPDEPLRLPTEDRLAEHYGVSVLTMRQALKELETEGLISRHRRRGTFIEPSARRGTPVRLLGSVDAIVAQQSGERTTVLEHGPAPVPAELAGYFPGLEEAASYRRLRRDEHGDEPTNWAENLVRPELAARIDLADLARWPMTKGAAGRGGGADQPHHRHCGGAPGRSGDRPPPPDPAAQPDPPLHGGDVRRGGPRGRRGPHPLPRRPLLVLGDGGRRL
ncbi:LOW QUALITY PROTEIN: putative GntR-family transcriptional regulator, partial [Streptomyces himastatinicus ATCC 53653]